MRYFSVILAAAVWTACPAEAPESSIQMEVLSEDTFLLDTRGSGPLRLDSLHHTETSGLAVFAGTCPKGSGEELRNERWIIGIEENGNASVEPVPSADDCLLSFEAIGDGRQQWMIRRDARGDTLWRCRLEGTGDFDNAIMAIRLSDGGYVAVSHPDCWSTGTYLARIAPGGELVWKSYLTTNYLLDMPEEEGEIYPKVLSVRQTAQGDFLVCGSVQEWITSPSAMYVALLDKSTGEPIWKTARYLMGVARACDITVTASGGIVAVGSTAEAVYPEDGPHVAQWGEPSPFVALLDPSGEMPATRIFDSSALAAYTGVLESDPETGELVILGRASSPDPGDFKVLRALLGF
ncbi:MAG: hypothetical protein R6U36_03040 [Candidatus Fermentibacteraceae bacterium]